MPHYLKNLSSVEVFSDVEPWDFTRLDLVPQECFGDKAARDAWINHPDTTFHVYSLMEGVQSNLRIHAGENTDEASNPPIFARGVAADYDTKLSLSDIQAAVVRMGDLKPNYFEQTLSGNARLLWMFEEPLRFPSMRFAKLALKSLLEFLPIEQLPAFDRPAFLTPGKYYTNGCRWEKLSSILVPADFLRGFILKTSAKFDWTAKELGRVAVSMELIAGELKRKFPSFAEWPGDFVIGAQGPTFWVPASKSPKSAIVKETGIFTFSGNAPKPFYSWAELVGEQFVERTEDEHLGKAVKGIYFDGRNYFMPGADGKVESFEATILKRHLTVMRGVSDRKPKDGGSSMLDKSLAFIEHHQRIKGAASCAFYPKGVFQYNGNSVLNTHALEALAPHPEPRQWGPTGHFPFTSSLMDTMFVPKPDHRQLDYLLAWAKRFYSDCLRRSPRSGHGVIVSGPVNAGKTFFNRCVIGGLVGGFGDAYGYLMGQDGGFNSTLFEKALWCVDDGAGCTSQALRRLYTEAIKRIIANRDHVVNEKFQKAVLAPWQGRLYITGNDDPISIGNLPEQDGSVKEKLILLRAGPRQIQFPDPSAMPDLLNRELPAFARWLLDWTPPDYVLADADVRFGVMEYCEDSLRRTSNLSSASSSFAEILRKWLREYFEREPGKLVWIGSVTDLRIAMLSDAVYAEALRGFKPEFLPRTLLLLHEKQIFEMEMEETDTGRIFTFHREDVPKAPTPGVPQTENSRYQKT